MKNLLALILFIILFSASDAQGIVLYGTCRAGGNAIVTSITVDTIPYGDTVYIFRDTDYFSGGTIFQYFPSNNSLATAYNFDSTSQGYDPVGRLMQASDGKIYGLTTGGGANGAGTIFQFDPVSMQYNKKYDFNSDNSGPTGALVQAGNKLYGMDSSGPANVGEIYSFDITADTFAIEYDFILGGAWAMGGVVPHGDLTLFNNNLYGVTNKGGANDDGVIFKYDPSGKIYSKIFDFGGFYGYNPTGKMTGATNGKLYCITSTGGTNNNGTILEYDPDQGSITKTYDFDNNLTPTGSLLLASDGNLYAFGDSIYSQTGGVIFAYSPGANSINVDYVMSSNNNVNAPGANLMQASNGLLYCADYTIYSFDYTNDTYKNLQAFTDSIGSDPFDGLLQVQLPLGIQNVKTTDLSLYPNPATNEVTIQNVIPTQDAAVKIMDVTGRTIISNFTSLADKIVLDTHTLTPGMYLVELKQGNLIYTGRFVKMD